MGETQGQTRPGAEGTTKTNGESVERNDILAAAVRWLVRHLRGITIYVGVLSALVLALTTLRDRLEVLAGEEWLYLPVAVLPLAAALVGESIPAWLKRRRQNHIIHVVEEKPGYFRVSPYDDTADDRSRYTRADRAHERVQEWLVGTDQTVLYLTGLSGTGKSSLIHAYALPKLREVSPPVHAVVVRSFRDPLEDLKSKILKPGVVWERPPTDLSDVRALLKRASDHVRPGRLLLVFDQFEEFLILHERDQERRRALADLLASLQREPIGRLKVLLVVRSEYIGALQDLLPRAALPPLQQEENWTEISAFSERHARDFVDKSGLRAGKDLLNEIFREVTQIDETVGLVRPITLNIVGLVLVRTALAEERRLPSQGKDRGLVLSYLRRCVERSDVRDYAAEVLRPMITASGTKQPKTVTDLARETGLPEAAVTGCLLILSNDGLVRRIDEQDNLWEISHDFVARLLTHVLSTRHRDLLRALRPWLAPTALAAAILLAGGLMLRSSHREEHDADYAAALVARLELAETPQVPAIVAEVSRYRRWTDPLLVRNLEQPTGSPKKKLHARLALLPVDPGQVKPLSKDLLHASPSELLVIRAALTPYKEQLTEGLWQLRLDGRARPEQRFRAACALATFDADNPKWAAVAPDVVAELMADLVLLNQWVEVLQPVRLALLGPLGQAFRDGNEPQRRVFVASILANYAADQPDVLAGLVVDAGAREFAVLFPKLAENRESVIAAMEQELRKTLRPEWGDGPPDPSWSDPPAALAEKFEGGQGMLTDHFAFCQSMPLEGFAVVAEGLRPCGYRPTRFRPFATGDSVQVAAVWTRDGRDWRMAKGLPAEAMRKQDAAWQEQNFLPLDAAGYIQARQAECYAALWVKSAGKGEETKAFFGLSHTEHGSVEERFKGSSSGYAPTALHLMLGIDGTYRLSSIWQKEDPVPAWRRYWGMNPSLHARRLNPGNVGRDVCLHQGPKPPANVNPFAAVNLGDTNELQQQPKAFISFALKLASGIQKYGEGKDREAIEDFSSSISDVPFVSLGYSFRAMARARLGNLESARKDLALSGKYADSATAFGSEVLSLCQQWHAYADVIVSADLGEDDAAVERLESFVADRRNNAEDLFIAARAYAAASTVVGRTPKNQGNRADTKASRYAVRAVALLADAIALGKTSEHWELQTLPDLSGLGAHPGLKAVLEKEHLERQYAALWQVTAAPWDWQEVHGLGPHAHLERCRELAAQGYRPRAIGAASFTAGDPLVTASIWYRPAVLEQQKDVLARRQAKAALALLRIGQADSAWRRLLHTPDPRLRTYLIHLLAPWGAEPQALVERLELETNSSARRALILGLGEYPFGTVPEEISKPLARNMLEAYQHDPDPGVHSALDWLLRQWGRNKDLQQIDRKLVSRAPPRDRLWYVNGQMQTLAVVRGPVEFHLGAPGSEEGRESDEALQPTSIGRSFAIATKDTTVSQFLRFRPDHAYSKKESPDPNGPIIEVTWYDAAKYCRWLSEQEEVPEEQMCFPPLNQINSNMVLPRDYLSRTGYRLPTQAEWEYACRAGAVTSRCFGEDEVMLQHYAWYKKNSGEHAWPVGKLKPNDLGLFDVHGNVNQWCLDVYDADSRRFSGRAIADRPSRQPGTHRVAKGGSNFSPFSLIRSAYRFSEEADVRYTDLGFRLARTLPR
jgi:formylglycine-generating enzyme required for sulfatase activity